MHYAQFEFWDLNLLHHTYFNFHLSRFWDDVIDFWGRDLSSIVVPAIQRMQTQIEQEGEKEKDLFEKFKC